jgi:hypothetical protein
VTLLLVVPAPLLGLLALAGCAALVLRVGRALVRLAISVAEKAAIGGMLEVSVRHGDLTAMAERERYLKALAATRLRAVAGASLWSALLVVPPLAGVATPVYAACVVLWLLPRRPLRLTAPPAVPAQPVSEEPPSGVVPASSVFISTGPPPPEE